MNIAAARSNMIQQQIRTWEVLDQRILKLLNDTRRETFLPDDYQALAFADTPIPIGHKQYTMTPKIEARLLQALQINAEDNVLEIGTGCAYLSYLLARTAKTLTSIDIFPDFIAAAKEKMEFNHVNNATFECCDAYSFLDTKKNYDIIVLTASLPNQDMRFLKRLAANGKIFVIVGESPVMEARIITKKNDAGYSYESIFETDLPALIGSEKNNTFVF